MNQRADIIQELTGISPVVAGLPATLPYTVPDGYFDNLSDDLLAAVAEGSSSIPDIRHLPTQEVPAGYFDTLASQVLQKIHHEEPVLEELQSLSPLLQRLDRATPGEVPAGYFEALPRQVMQAVRSEKTTGGARILAFTRPLRTAMAAAVTIGVIALSAIWGMQVYNNETTPMNNGLQIQTSEQFDFALSNVSDQEIVEYLKQHTERGDMEAIANQVNEEDLPEVDDYFGDNATKVNEWLNNNGETNIAF